MKFFIVAFFIFITVNLLVEVGAVKSSSTILKARLNLHKRSLKADEKKETGEVGVHSVFLESQSRLSSKFKKLRPETDKPVTDKPVLDDSTKEYIEELKEKAMNQLRIMEAHVATLTSKEDEKKGIHQMAKLLSQIQFLDHAILRLQGADSSLTPDRNETIIANEEVIKLHMKEIQKPKMMMSRRNEGTLASLRPSLDMSENEINKPKLMMWRNEDTLASIRPSLDMSEKEIKENKRAHLFETYRVIQNEMATINDKTTQHELLLAICKDYPLTAKEMHLCDKLPEPIPEPIREPIRAVLIEKDHSDSPTYSLFESSFSVKSSK